MTTFITIIYVIVALVMVLSILLQSGKGGGLGSALGGGASQSVFGGGGGADFMSKLTQGFAFTFMISAMYLAYASAHAGSEFLEGEDQGTVGMFETDEEINPERLGPRPQQLPTPEEGKIKQAAASALVPAQSAAPADLAPEAAPPTEATQPPPGSADPQAGDNPVAKIGDGDLPAEGSAPVDEKRGDSPDSDRGDSPHSGEENLQEAPPSDESLSQKNAQTSREDGKETE